MAQSAVTEVLPPSRPSRVESVPLPMVRSRAKRALDVAGAAALMLVTAPVAGLIALAIRLDSPGPVLLRQERCGLGGRRFTCLKFRSMHHNVDDAPHRAYVRALVTGVNERPKANGAFKLLDDDRITRAGRWLRRTSLDELPQLWNVLVGDMSLVGPRPPLPYEVELYDERQHQRLRCKPGLTGLWQVSGRNQLSYRDMCEIDLRYLADWSHRLDLLILLRTLPVVIFNSGRAA